VADDDAMLDSVVLDTGDLTKRIGLVAEAVSSIGGQRRVWLAAMIDPGNAAAFPEALWKLFTDMCHRWDRELTVYAEALEEWENAAQAAIKHQLEVKLPKQ
jgi:hypothetical protein